MGNGGIGKELTILRNIIVVAKAKQEVLILVISVTIFLINRNHSQTLPLLIEQEFILLPSIVEFKLPKFRVVIKIQERAVFYWCDAWFQNPSRIICDRPIGLVKFVGLEVSR